MTSALTEPELHDLAREVFASEGMSEGEAARMNGLRSEVLCPSGLHSITDGSECWDCIHSCSNPGPECPGRG